MRSAVESSPSRLRFRPAAIASWLALAAPFLLFALVLPQFSELPRNDYWGDLLKVATPDGELSKDPRVWLATRSNEHWIGALIPLWLANYAATGGDNRGLGAISLLLLVVLFAILYRRLPIEVRRRPLRRLLWGLPIAAAVASPAAAHNWELGFSGNQWFLANLMAVWALARLARGPREWPRDLPAVVWPLAVAILTHSTYLSLAAALGAGAVILPQRRAMRIGLVAVATAAVAAFAIGYERPPHHPAPRRDPLAAVEFTLQYLGGFFSEQPVVTLIVGALGVAILALAAGRLLRGPSAVEERFWLLIAIYGATSGALTAVARGGLGQGLATATSRYASLQALFWIGTLTAAALALRDRALPRALRFATGLLLVGGLVANERIGLDRVIARLDRDRWQPPAALALRWGVTDREVLAHVSQFMPPRSIQLLRKLGHVPFDRPAEGPPGALVPPPAPGAPTDGAWTTTRTLERRDYLRVSGTLPRRDVDIVLFLDAAGAVRGAAVPLAEPATGLGALVGLRPPVRHWIGYLKREDAATAVPVYRATGDGPTVALAIAPGARRVQRDE